jgi:hypothetical protein
MLLTRYSFMARTKVTTRGKLLTVLHQIMVELCIMQELKKPLKNVCDILEHQPENLVLISQVEVQPSSDLSTAALIFPSEEAKTNLFAFFEEFDKTDTVPEAQLDGTVAETNAEAEAGAAGPSGSLEVSETVVSQGTPNLEVSRPRNIQFLSIRLEDPKFKFAVSSFFFQDQVCKGLGFRIGRLMRHFVFIIVAKANRPINRPSHCRPATLFYRSLLPSLQIPT